VKKYFIPAYYISKPLINKKPTMKKIKKTLLISTALLLPLIFLTGCSKVSLTGTTNTGAPANGAMGTPPDGAIPPEGGTPPTDGGTPPSGAPAGAPAN
jgi:hypothetical protein